MKGGKEGERKGDEAPNWHFWLRHCPKFENVSLALDRWSFAC